MKHPSDSLTVGEKIMVTRHRRKLTRQDLGKKMYIILNIKPWLKVPAGQLKKIETGCIFRVLNSRLYKII